MKDALILSILEATKESIIRRGYTATTTKRIAQEAKISEMSLFRAFKKKKRHRALCFRASSLVP
ncbi:TetR/AcrR family transcriptional regulator [Listeria grayi FSL F6-1183]|uniref:TetR/AcrR family transcriptional regulator n=1 Tax=Listeria grayi FSL F6-1183 TaxID=1265827 RepID=A0A829R7D7_LISGR|nr:TetR/AcrR family transcriptional regulator [Listeria grayi FSL F6-1183]